MIGSECLFWSERDLCWSARPLDPEFYEYFADDMADWHLYPWADRIRFFFAPIEDEL